VEDHTENFGERMTRLKRERGIPLAGPGRKPIAEKYQHQIAAVEQTFADALSTLASEYIDPLRVHSPDLPRAAHHVALPDGGLHHGEPPHLVQSQAEMARVTTRPAYRRGRMAPGDCQ
jgi:hypothetical protein